jgi:hypothetical protein
MSLDAPPRPPLPGEHDGQTSPQMAREETVHPGKNWTIFLVLLAILAVGSWGVFRAIESGNEPPPPTTVEPTIPPTTTSSSTTTTTILQ